MNLDESASNTQPSASAGRTANTKGIRLFLWGYAGKEIFSLLVVGLFYLLPFLVSPGMETEGWGMAAFGDAKVFD